MVNRSVSCLQNHCLHSVRGDKIIKKKIVTVDKEHINKQQIKQDTESLAAQLYIICHGHGLRKKSTQ